jgi:DNA-binding CsgD family transcriptional regulator
MTSEITIIVNKISASWTIAISLIFAFVLWNIHQRMQQSEKPRSTQGVKYLSFALLTWAISSITTIIYYTFFVNEDITYSKIVYFAIIIVLSIFNSALILLAIPSIELEEELPNRILPRKKKNIGYLLLGLIAGTGLIAFVIFDKSEGNNNDDFIKQPIIFIGSLDILFALIVIWELVLRKIHAFKERNLNFMVSITLILIFCMLMSQILDILPAFSLELEETSLYLITHSFLHLTYKTLLISLFILLLYSWQIKKEKENIKKYKFLIEKQQSEIEEQKIMLNTSSQNDDDLQILSITPSQFDSLTNKEKDVFRNHQTGLTYQEIATELDMAKSTVITHTRAIQRAFNIKSKDALQKISKKYFND